MRIALPILRLFTATVPTVIIGGLIAGVKPERQAEEVKGQASGWGRAGRAEYVRDHPDYTDEEKELFAAVVPMIRNIVRKVRKRADKDAKREKKVRKPATDTKGNANDATG